MKQYLMMALGLAAWPLLANTPPEITNVRASQRADTKLVDIYYDAADADGDLLKVRIEISDNDGAKYSVPAFSLTGDIGEGVAAGKDKHIVWDAGTDWDGEYSDKMRVKVYAIDAQGFPGLEWGNEVPPGGFLMGQDGGAEGSGPSRHVNIPWSYWLSKYEITCQQYCDFLNAALVSGFVSRDGTTSVYTIPGALPGINAARFMISTGDDWCIRWNVNNFEVVGSCTNHPICVSWYGALAFCRYYGYDLPTEAEWEKSARGPNHDDQDEHLIYPWGNETTGSCANYLGSGHPYGYGATTPVGYYNGNQTPLGSDMVNGYGLYDVIGNVEEWTRSLFGNDSNYAKYTVESYPGVDDLEVVRNRAIPIDNYFVTRGGNSGESWPWPSYYRRARYDTACDRTGFRVARRSCDDVSKASRYGALDFETLDDGAVSGIESSIGSFSVTNGVVNCVSESSGSVTNKYLVNSAGCAHITLQLGQRRLRYVKFKMFNRTESNARYNFIKLVSINGDGTSTYNEIKGDCSGVWTPRSLVAAGDAVSYYLELYSYTYPVSIDDIEFFTTEN